MKHTRQEQIELMASKFRAEAGLTENEPLHVKTLLLHLGVLTAYRSMSDSSYGFSMKTTDNHYRFILVNSNSRRGRQHFTIAHELYHLYFDPNPQPHICRADSGREATEITANAFASVLLMPRQGLLKEIPGEEIAERHISMATILRLEQLFGVSHEAMVNRLKHLELITDRQREQLLNVSILNEARAYGFDLSLYQPGNENLMIGDFGQKAKALYDAERISEGHYHELLNLIYHEQ